MRRVVEGGEGRRAERRRGHPMVTEGSESECNTALEA